MIAQKPIIMFDGPVAASLQTVTGLIPQRAASSGTMKTSLVIVVLPIAAAMPTLNIRFMQ
ncbi:hypothetical protein [Pseudomonas sp. NPDC086251]|uniref:hypothetical protein n=1 Tax=Pseudomonas sp. NPDC086251 TaxID=3364431 RepID=UPI00383802DA